MDKVARNLRYGDRLADGRYVLKVEAEQDVTRIIFVGGTSVRVASDEPLALRKSTVVRCQPSLFAFPASELGGTRRENAATLGLAALLILLIGLVMRGPW